jgi:hypothetical protein
LENKSRFYKSRISSELAKKDGKISKVKNEKEALEKLKTL